MTDLEALLVEIKDINSQVLNAEEKILDQIMVYAELRLALGRRLAIAQQLYLGSWQADCKKLTGINYKTNATYQQLAGHADAYLAACKKEERLIGFNAFLGPFRDSARKEKGATRGSRSNSARSDSETEEKAQQYSGFKDPNGAFGTGAKAKAGPQQGKEEVREKFREAFGGEPETEAGPHEFQSWNLTSVMLYFGIDIIGNYITPEALDWLMRGFRTAYHPDKGFNAEITQKAVALMSHQKRFSDTNTGGAIQLKRKRGF